MAKRIGAVLLAVAGVGLPAIRFFNPSLTETQLLSAYWPLWLALIGLCVLGARLVLRP